MLEELEQEIEEVILIPSRGGVFEVVVDGDLRYSKKATGKHADLDEVVAGVRKLVR